MDTEFELATVTKMLSYPITIASFLHEYSSYSYNKRGPLTLEGLKSIAALRYTLYPSKTKNTLVNNNQMRIFIVAARAESQLPGHVWKQSQFLFPPQNFMIHFIDPQCQLNETKQPNSSSSFSSSSDPLVKKIDNASSLVSHPQYFHELHSAYDFYPYDPYNDVFFIFHPGFAYSDTTDLWMNYTMKCLLDTKCAIFHTGFNASDIMNDVVLLKDKYGKELDILLELVKIGLVVPNGN